MRHSRLHELNGGSSIDDLDQQASGSVDRPRGLTRLSVGSREDGELDRKSSLKLSEDVRAWSGSSHSVRLPEQDGSRNEPASKRRKPNDDSSVSQTPQGLSPYDSEATHMGARMPGSSSVAPRLRNPPQTLDPNPTTVLRAAAGLDAMPLYSAQGAFDAPNANYSHAYGPNGTIDRLTNPDPNTRQISAPTSALMFARNLDSHLTGHLIDHIRNPQDNYATSYRTPQSDGDSHTTPTSIRDPLVHLNDRHAHIGELRDHSQGPTLGLHVETPYSGGQPYPEAMPLDPMVVENQGNMLGLPMTGDVGNGLDVDSSFNFETNAYGLPMGFGIEETSDLDLLQFLASDTSIAFAHTSVYGDLNPGQIQSRSNC